MNLLMFSRKGVIMKRGVFLLCVMLTCIVTWAWSKKVEPNTPAPKLKVIAITVDDTIVGNGNGILEPGETADLSITVYNAGTATAYNVYASLDSADEGISLLNTVISFGDIPPGNIVTSSTNWQVQASSTIPCGKDIMLHYTFNGTNVWSNESYRFPMRKLMNVNDPGTLTKVDQGDIFLYGPENGDSLGGALATGDINGDGKDDLIIGAQWGDGAGNAKNGSGEVWVVYGPLLSDVDLASPPTNSLVIYGRDSLDQLAVDIATGDINGDGYDDIIMSSTEADGPSNGRTNSGEVWVVFGGPSLTGSIDLASPPGGTLVIYGADTNDSLGSGVATGDINQDGFDDILIGAWQGDGPSGTKISAGEVWVIFGSSSFLPSIDLAAPPVNTLVVYGKDASDYLGYSVGSGDVNDDGFDDLILGAFGGDGPWNGRGDNGEVWVLYGSSSIRGSIDLTSPPSGTTVIYGRDAGDRFGRVVHSGDVNHDGFSDILVSSYQADGPGNSRSNSGELWFFYGGTSLPQSIDLLNPPSDSYPLFGIDASDNMGTALSIGDLDGDGYGDIVGSVEYGAGPNNTISYAGEAYIYYGNSTIAPVDFKNPPKNTQVVYGVDTNDFFGHAVTTGDFNDDGIDDLALSAYISDGSGNSRTDAGEVLLMYGQARFHYSSRTEGFNFIDATTGTLLPLTCDNCCTKVTLPFSFTYYNRTYTYVYVCDDGYISFSPVSYPNRMNDCMGGQNLHPDNLIAVFWDDLNPSAGGGVYMLSEGTAPNRRITFEWSAVPHYPAIGDATFEVTLFENSNQILVQYLDTFFGDATYDSGASAVAGVENITGALSTSRSCLGPNLTNSTAHRYIPFGTYRLYAKDFTTKTGWTISGLWHLNTAYCQPAYHSESYSMYYGDDTFCYYKTINPNSGSLTSSTLSADYYSYLYHWTRIQRDNGPNTDYALLRVSANGGPTAVLFDGYDRFVTNPVWKKYRVDVSSYSGNTVQFEFFFDTVDTNINNILGWMIDDFELYGCDVYGTTPIINALAYARPTPVCSTNTYLLDGSGTYITNCSSISYQWYENGIPISGATGVQYTIDAQNHATGVFSYVLRATCTSTGDYDDSDPVSVQIVPMPPSVPNFMLSKRNAGTQIHMVWDNVSGGDSYNIFQDLDPASTFATQVVSAPDGPTGVDIAMPTDTKVYYLVAGSNTTCGEGPKK